ncbi:unnamed protein product [Owenia fusiformis]|uniref:Uncharacterized protein n=1 Tax=Owenia fusiformis TaxID=6347 RepID=A0A8J1XX56_OWEFU|nr:unnamed protein product [Owenia fusiformis]
MAGVNILTQLEAAFDKYNADSTVIEMDNVAVDISELNDLDENKKNNELKEGKEYHLFFAHSKYDLQWVMDLVAILESEPYNLKCAFSERDFMPGTTDMNEIYRCVVGSLKTVFVITPDFNESSWCNMELQMTQTAACNTDISILPIKLKECEVPNTIQHINFINAINVSSNLIASKIKENINKQPIYSVPKSFNHRAINGTSIPIESVNIKRQSCFLSNHIQCELEFQSLHEKDVLIQALRQREIDITEEEMKSDLDKIHRQIEEQSTNHSIRIDDRTYNMLRWTVNVSMLFLFIMGLLKTQIHGWIPLFIVSDILLLIILMFSIPAWLYFRVYGQMDNQLTALLLNIKYISQNEITNKDHTTYTIGWSELIHEYSMEAFSKINLILMKYDYGPCKQELFKYIKRHNTLTMTDAQINKTINDIWLKHELGYTLRLYENKVPKPVAIRHPTINDQACFCQEMEKEILGLITT